MKNVNNSPITRRNKASDPNVLASSLADKANYKNDWVNLKSLGAKIDGVTDDTTILQNAVNTYSTVYIPAGTLCHTGITLPLNKPVQIVGAGLEITFLKNISPSNHSISGIGVGSSYPRNSSIRDLSITSDTVRTGQYGIYLKWATTIRFDNIRILYHDRGVNEYCCWDLMYLRVLCYNNNYGWYVENANMNGTPNYRYYCSGNNNNQYGLFIENDLELFKWYGGEIGGNLVGGVRLCNNTAGNVINIEFDTINFENNSGTDVEIGLAGGTAPRNFAFRNCRFFRSSTNIGTQAVLVNVGGKMIFDNCEFAYYTYAVYDNGFYTTIMLNCNLSNVTNGIYCRGKIYSSVAFGVYSYLGASYFNAGSTTFNQLASTSAINNSIFMNTSNILSFKDNGGVTQTIPLDISGSGAPTTTPSFLGQGYIDTTNKKYYKAMGTTASTDWVIIN